MCKQCDRAAIVLKEQEEGKRSLSDEAADFAEKVNDFLDSLMTGEGEKKEYGGTLVFTKAVITVGLARAIKVGVGPEALANLLTGSLQVAMKVAGVTIDQVTAAEAHSHHLQGEKEGEGVLGMGKMLHD